MTKYLTKNYILWTTLFGVLFVMLYFAQSYNYLLFHTIVEAMSALPSIMISVIVLYLWNYLEDNNFLSVLGISLIFIGVIDFIHSMAYKGMPIFIGFDSNLPTQLWILARYVQMVSFVLAAILINRTKHINRTYFIIIYTVVVMVMLWAIFISKIFPDTFIEGSGLTKFKVNSEYIISIGLLLSGVIIWKKRERFTKNMVQLLLASILFQICSELSFSSYISVYGFSNFLGHYFKVIWVLLLYRAILGPALASSRELLFKELVASEKQLKESERQLDKALDNAPIPIMLTNEDGKVLRISKKWTEVSGYTLKDIPTINDWLEKSYISYFDSEAVKEMIAKSYDEKKETLPKDVEITTLKGKKRIWQFNTANIGTDSKGKKIVFSAVLDITENKEAEKNMDTARIAAEENTATQAAFLANMSHEIRTPLNGILGVNELLLLSELNDEQKELVDLSKSTADALLVIINDILDYSKTESGMVTLEEEVFNLRTVIKDVLSLARTKIKDGSVELKYNCDTAIPTEIKGDSIRVRQILTNIVGNAIKYTNTGQVNVSVKRSPLNSIGKMKLEFMIQDTGIGIPFDKQRQIFERFHQANPSDGKKYGGTGLGLAIANDLVKLMGGELWVESEVGLGSRFFFTCVLEDYGTPNEIATKISVKANNDSSIKTDIKLLLVEDDPVSQMVIQRFAQLVGISAKLAKNGKEALVYYRAHDLDAIFMDLQMPLMNGIEATKSIRELELESGKHIPIIAMTAYAMIGDKEKCLEAGMDDYISKPISKDSFYNALSNWTNYENVVSLKSKSRT